MLHRVLPCHVMYPHAPLGLPASSVALLSQHQPLHVHVVLWVRSVWPSGPLLNAETVLIECWRLVFPLENNYIYMDRVGTLGIYDIRCENGFLTIQQQFLRHYKYTLPFQPC